MLNQSQIINALQSAGHVEIDTNHGHLEAQDLQGILTLLVIQDGTVIFDGYTDLDRIIRLAKTLH